MRRKTYEASWFGQNLDEFGHSLASADVCTLIIESEVDQLDSTFIVYYLFIKNIHFQMLLLRLWTVRITCYIVKLRTFVCAQLYCACQTLRMCPIEFHTGEFQAAVALTNCTYQIQTIKIRGRPRIKFFHG
jgi:hypothetical protein